MTSDMMALSKKLYDPDFGISQGQAAEILAKSCGFYFHEITTWCFVDLDIHERDLEVECHDSW